MSHVGKNNPRYGTVCNAETKQKISELAQRRNNAGYSHKELYDIFIKPNGSMSIDQLIDILPVRRAKYLLKKLIAKFSS